MLNKSITDEFHHIFPEDISEEFPFSIEEYMLFLDALSINPLNFFYKWTEMSRQSIVNKYWMKNTKSDWKWLLSFPFFTVLEKYLDSAHSPKIIGFSGLPGSGKSTLGVWINGVARDLNLDIRVISLDDYYLPGKEMDIAMRGNPWNVPRGLPGSHSTDLLNQSLDDFLKTGVLKCPTFEKSLRNGKGDRSGWCEFKASVLVLEGWFVGCEPISNLKEIDYISKDKFNLSLSQVERNFRISIQKSLLQYIKIWKKLDKIWHLKSSHFNNMILWKTQQEKEMINIKGSGLKDKPLNDFIRMIQAAIPQQSLTSIKSDTIIQINQDRKIENLSTNTYIF